MLVFGTRPEAIKMAPLCLAFRECRDFETVICVTAQHREMLDQVMNVFSLSPDIDLNIMKKDQDLNDVTRKILLNMREVFKKNKPDVVFIHGDTTTTMATAMAAFYAGIPVAHVEAGLRTYDIMAPFPEEFNRRMASITAQFHFAPTAGSEANLVAENISPKKIWVTGNTVIDALHWVVAEIKNNSALETSLIDLLTSHLKFEWLKTRYVLITGHRRENFGQGFLDICTAVQKLAIKHPTVHFVYPVHLNPNVQTPVNSLLGDLRNVHLVKPLGYQSFVYLLSKCYLVLTDSGGIQEEAPSLGKPVLVMRETTERPEAVSAGTVKLVGTSTNKITESITELMDNQLAYQAMSVAHNPYGDGKACKKIVEFINQLN